MNGVCYITTRTILTVSGSLSTFMHGVICKFHLLASIKSDAMTKIVFVCRCKMILFNAGLCSCTGDSFMVDPNTQYQFRIQLSRTPSCHCINAERFTNQLITLLSGRGSGLDWYHAESSQIIIVPSGSSNAKLCPSDNNTNTFLSPILQHINNSQLSPECNNDTFCPHNTTDHAVAYEETFANSCTTERCFPFARLNKTQM